LAEIAWLDGPTPSIFGDGPAADAVLKFISSDHGRQILTLPSAHAELWRERSFDVFDNDELLSGTFDRVHIESKDGRAISAHIYDFKTDGDSGDIQARYREQLDTYRRAAARLLDLDVEQIKATAVGVP
jgi:ATP-dependent exoDNAse (exonuclease V) beta subunit